MRSKDENVGKKFNMLAVLDIKIVKENKNYRKYYFCHCDCENEKWIRADSILSGKQTSCGCLSDTTKYKAKDITNMHFDRLIAIKPVGKTKDGGIVWECKCECNNIVSVEASSLLNGKTKSCGCLQIEMATIQGLKEIKKFNENNIVDDTNIQAIKTLKPLSNNKTGYKGVSYDEKRCKYIAQIDFQKKHYNLGRFKTAEEASEVYKKAKNKLHDKFLEWYENECKKTN